MLFKHQSKSTYVVVVWKIYQKDNREEDGTTNQLIIVMLPFVWYRNAKGDYNSKAQALVG